jgi:TolB-like protein
MSPDKEQEYFADGISEELLNLLAQVPELRVIARTSSFSFKGKDVDIAEIARRLNVANVLEGSVRRSGDKLRITAQLVRASDSSHLWSQTYDRQMTDVFQMQDEIAAAVVSELKIMLVGSAPTARVTDPKAYALFLRAREIARLLTEASLEESIPLYQQALKIDPAYTAAWVGLGYAYSAQAYLSLRPADEGRQLVREATEKALAIDPQYAPAHAQLGEIAIYYDRDLAAGARHIERALALEPANPDIMGAAAGLARRLGRLDQAIAIGEYRMVRDPVNNDTNYELATAYFFAGHLDKAIATYRADLTLFPQAEGDHEMMGEVLLKKGDAKAALAEIQKEPGESWRLGGLSMAYYALGQQAESDAALGELIEKYEKTMAWGIGCALAFRGDADRAFAWLNKAVEYNDPTLMSTAGYPTLANLHSDPRWLPFLRKIGLAPEQLAAIEFDVKVPR